MDPDEFNDFESPTNPQPPSPPLSQPQLSHPPSSPLPVSEQPQADLPAIILQPSYSTMTNAPSQQTGETENTGWEGSKQSILIKIESQHIAEVNHIEVDFSKRTSEGEKKVQLQDSSHSSEFTGIYNGQESNISNEGTVNSHSVKDFYFENIPQKSLQDSHETHIIIDLQREETKITKQEGKLFEKKEHNEQVFQLGNEQIGQLEQFQGVQTFHEQEKNEIQDIMEIKREEQQYQQNLQGQITHQEEKEHINFLKRGSQQQQQGKEENHQPSQHLQSPSHNVSQEEDQFGDFQQTLETALVPPNQHFQNGVEDEHKVDLVLNKVQVYPERAPLGTVVQKKERQLQEWVDSLPDYSFLLKEGFNSL